MSDTPPRYAYPHAVENGGGERLVFVRRVPGAAGERVVAENLVSPGSGPPMHVHHLQTEALTVLEGRMGYQRLGQPAQFAGPGEEVVFAAGEAHRFWNADNVRLRCSAWIEPPDNIEYFLTELFDSTRRNGGRRPHPLDAAFLLTRYRSEFGLPAIPALVQRVVFPLLVLAGRLTGRYRRYRDAPEPVRRRRGFPAPGFMAAALIVLGCSWGEADHVTDAQPPWYQEVRTLDLTGDGRADTARLEAAGRDADSLRITLALVTDGTVKHEESWGSSYDLTLVDSALRSGSRADSLLRARLDSVLSSIRVQHLDAPGVQIMAEDSAILANVRPRPAQRVSFSYGYETTVRLMWDATERRFVRLWSCC